VNTSRFSELYCRFNGFMLGTFLTLSRFQFAEAAYGAHRQRIQEFLHEVEIELALPESHQELDKRFDDIYIELLSEVNLRSPLLFDFAYIGSGTQLMAGVTGHDDETATELKSELVPRLERYALGSQLLQAFLERVPSGDERKRVDDLLDPAFVLLQGIISPLEPEPETCFVAMPFKPPFADRFPGLYRPLLEQAGYRSLRAWGGLSAENYAEAMLETIRKSGVMLAELTGVNPNVMYEIGAAHGLGKTVYMLVEKDAEGPIPANIGHDALYTYELSREGAFDEAVLLGASYVLAARLGADDGGDAGEPTG
jgi:hypothetical protein